MTLQARPPGRRVPWPSWLVAVSLIGLAGCFGKSEQELLDSARAYADRGDNQAAIVELRKLLQTKPNSAAGGLMLGRLLQQSGNYAGAELEYRRAITGGQSPGPVLPPLATVLLAQGKAKQLLEQYGSQSIPDAQTDAEFKTLLAAARAALGEHDAAMALLDQAQAKATDTAVVELQRARLLAGRGQAAPAMALVEAVVQRQPRNARALAQQGDLLASAGQLEEAVAAWRASVAVVPGDIAVQSALLAGLMERKDRTAAQAQWQVLRKVAPAHPQTAYFEALLAEQRGDMARARLLSQQLLKSAPDSLRVLMLAGRIESRMGSAGQAEALYAKAVTLAPGAAAPRLSLAQVQLRSGLPDKALETLEPMTRLERPPLEALLTAAQAELLKGETGPAQKIYERAGKLAPDDLRVRTANAIVLLSKRQDAAAFKELQAIAAADPGTTADLALIHAKIRRAAWDDALAAIDRMAAKVPKEPQPDHLRASIALQRKDAAAARQAFDKALSIDPDFMPTLASLTSLDLAEGKAAEARARMEAVVQRNPRHVAAMAALADLNTRTGGRIEDTTRWLQAAVNAEPGDPGLRRNLLDHLLRHNLVKPAMEAALAATSAFPEDLRLLERLGRAQILNGEAKVAVGTFQKMTYVAPSSAIAQLRLAMAHTAANDAPAARAALQRAIKLGPDEPEVLRAAAEMEWNDRKPAQALAAARQLQQRDKVAGLALEGDLEMRQKNWAAAAAAYRKAMALQPGHDVALRLHNALLFNRQAAEAEQLAAAWRQQHPEDLAFVLTVADRAMANRQPAQAEQLYREVLAARPKHLLALNNLAYALATQKKPGAVAAAEQAVALAPDSAPFLDTLAFCLAAEKEWSKAIKSQKRAIELAPAAPQYRLQLARLHLAAGDKSDAVDELKKLQQLGSAFPRQAEVEALLKSAKG